MTPDKNQPSDNTPDNSDEGVEDNVVSIDDIINAAKEGSVASTEAENASAGEADSLDYGEQAIDEANQEPETPLDEIGQLRAQLAEAEAKASENWDRLLRLQAEMENQRKRAQNDVTKARKFALEGIVGDLLPVKDSLEMGLLAAQGDEAEIKSIVEGADLTLKMLAQVFEKNNIIEVDPIDEKFDPEFHQAMSMQEIEGKEANTVASVMQKGYTLNERLVRPALVMVAK